MTEEQRAELEKLARAAERDFGAVDIAVGGGMRGTETVPAFIAAASPTVFLDLLATIARLEAERVKDGEALEGAPDGFIAWSGGKNPAPGMRVDAIWLGDLHEDRPSDNLTWEHSDFCDHITAYRLSSRAKDQSQ